MEGKLDELDKEHPFPGCSLSNERIPIPSSISSSDVERLSPSLSIISWMNDLRVSVTVLEVSSESARDCGDGAEDDDDSGLAMAAAIGEAGNLGDDEKSKFPENESG